MKNKLTKYLTLFCFVCILPNCVAQKKVVEQEKSEQESKLVFSTNEHGILSVAIPSQGKNLFLGMNAGKSIMTKVDTPNIGNFNTFLGVNAGYENKKGRGNTAVGFRAGGKLKDNHMNSYMGMGAGAKLKAGNENTFIGAAAGAETGYGSRNTYLGMGAGGNIGHGPGAKENPIKNNVFIGFQAGAKGGRLGNNIFIGNKAGAKNRDGSGNIFIGHGAGETNENLSDALIIENSTSKTPLIFGSFKEDFVKINGKVGLQVIHGNRLASDGFTIQSMGKKDTTSWRMHIDNTTGELKLFSTKFSEANGPTKNVASINPMTGQFSVISDQRYKMNVELLANSLSGILSLEAYKYHFDGQQETEKKSIGFFAQSLKEVFPEVVTYSESTDVQFVNYDALAVIAIQAIQEQNKIIDIQEDKIEDLEDRVKKLEKQMLELINNK